MKNPATTLFLLFCILSAFAQAEDDPFAVVEPEEANENQAVVPSTLAEAHALLEEQLAEEELRTIDAMKSEEEMIEYHFGAGMGMRNSWGLWGDSPLAKHLRELGFTHADDMSAVILETFWCKRHNKELRIKERAEYYKAYWAENKWPDEKVVDPANDSEVHWSRGYEAEGRPHRMIYIGRSKASGRILAFENPTGVYVPDEKLLKSLRETDGGVTERFISGEEEEPLPELESEQAVPPKSDRAGG